MTEAHSRFHELIATITGTIAGQPLDAALKQRLDRDFPADGPVFAELTRLCHAGVAEGWLCAREAGGIRFGRIIKPGDATHGFSVDAVDMEEVVGPHHVHPGGEVDMVMPIDGQARFDGAPAGWVVYPPGSAHCPTVSDGRALVLYLLPGGAIEFTRDA